MENEGEEKEVAKKIVNFLLQNEVSIDMTGNYVLPANIVIAAVTELLKTGDSEILTKHRKWTWYNWDFKEMVIENEPQHFHFPLSELLEFKDLKLFWKDDYEMAFLDRLIFLEKERMENQKTYKYKRTRGFIVNLKKACRERDGDKCIRCGATERLEIDHIKELALGGENVLENLQTLCEQHHKEKTKKYWLKKKGGLYGKK